MLPLVVFLLGAASCVSVSTRGELVWVLIAVDVEVLGCPEANAEIRMIFAFVCFYLKWKKKRFGINEGRKKKVFLLSPE